jgi:dienelactone hydrolase
MTIIPKNFIDKPDSYPEKLSLKEINLRFRELLGNFEHPSVPLRLKITDETELPGDIVRQRIEYQVYKDETVPAYHLFKKDLPENAPGLLSIHGHGGREIFPVGKAYHCHPNKNDPSQYSYIAALNGFRVLAPDALCFGERQASWGYSSNFFDEIAAHAQLCSQGKSLAWKSVWDNSRALEVLEKFGVASIGVMGWSGGSTQAYILTAVNRKIKATACFFSYATLRHQFYQYRLAHCLYHYIPGMVQAGIDWDQVVSLIPPRKIFLGWGALDEGTPKTMYRAFCEAIKARDEKALTVFEEDKKGHEISKPMLKNALRFFKANLII